MENETLRGKFVVAEGGSCVGKTTLVNRLLEDYGWEYLREPGGTEFGEGIREVVQGLGKKEPIDPYASFFAYSAARAQLVRKVLLPRLVNGANILLDRYWYSSFAYQGAEGVSKVVIWAVSLIATKNLRPNLVMYLDLDPRVAAGRRLGKADLDRYDLREDEYMERVRANYLQLARLDTSRWRVIDASLSVEEVRQQAERYLREFHLI